MTDGEVRAAFAELNRCLARSKAMRQWGAPLSHSVQVFGVGGAVAWFVGRLAFGVEPWRLWIAMMVVAVNAYILSWALYAVCGLYGRQADRLMAQIEEELAVRADHLIESMERGDPRPD